MVRTAPLRIGFFSYLEGDTSASDIYGNVSDLFLAADKVGLNAGWVAQHHFRHHNNSGLPSPLIFFASVAAQTSQINVGTAVITPAFELDVRIAEDAAVLETLHPGRLQLGLGTGFATEPVLEIFGRAGQDKRKLYDEAIVRIYDCFAGEPLNDQGDRLYPPAPGLTSRVWEAPGSIPRVIEAAQRGSGLLLSRIAIGTDRDTDEVQRELVDAYYGALPAGVEPRIGLSRTVWASSEPEVVRKSLADGLIAGTKNRPEHASRSIDELFELYSVHWGTPEAVVASLQAEPLIDEVTDLICQLSPGTPTQDQALEALDLLATEVGPHIGWVPATAEPVAAD